MKTAPLSALCAALLACAVAALAAAQQTLERIPTVDFQRPTQLDAAGLKQFQAFDVKCEPCHGIRQRECEGCKGRELPNCPECKGTKRAPCRTCAGVGKLPDPLLEHICTYCRGGTYYDCALCNGMGFFYENSPGGERIEKPCGGCRRAGSYPCNVCGGKRLVSTLRIKRKPPTEATLGELREARAELEGWMKELEAFEPEDRAARSIKTLERILARPGRALPPLKDMLALHDEVQKGLVRAGSGYQNFAERQDFQIMIFRNRSIHLLRHNLRVLELCIERAEFNEGVAKSK